MLKNGQDAPRFSLVASDGIQHTLDQYLGKPLVVVLYRGRFCPTTKKFLTAWQDFYPRIQDLGAELIAMSQETPENSAWLRDQYDVKFPLLSDPKIEISKQYGVYVSTRRDGTEFGEPALVLLDKDGQVAYSVISSGPKGLANPGDVAPLLIYMSSHGGKY